MLIVCQSGTPETVRNGASVAVVGTRRYNVYIVRMIVKVRLLSLTSPDYSVLKLRVPSVPSRSRIFEALLAEEATSTTLKEGLRATAPCYLNEGILIQEEQ
jgi:hypothetical protein